MSLQFRKAERKKSKARIGLSGPAGTGKTMGALLLAYGITNNWDEIAIIDTENGSGELYVDYDQNGIKIGVYNTVPITAPYTPEKYIEALKLCEENGVKCAIIDSLTHAWAGEGGLLDQQGKLADKSGNSWTAWRSITPKHNQLVEKILSSPMHVIATLRAKMDYVQEKDSNGKTTVRKVGMGSIQRDGMEYEFTCFFELLQNHTAEATKDRTSLFDGNFFRITNETGKQLKAWLENGVIPEQPKEPVKPEQPKTTKLLMPSGYDRTKDKPSSEKQQQLINIKGNSLFGSHWKEEKLNLFHFTTGNGVESTKDLKLSEADALLKYIDSLVTKFTKDPLEISSSISLIKSRESLDKEIKKVHMMINCVKDDTAKQELIQQLNEKFTEFKQPEPEDEFTLAVPKD